MRVCVLALDDPWRQRDGGTVRTRLLVDALRDAGHETSVAYVTTDGALLPELPGVAIATVPTVPLGERSWAQPLGKLKRHFLPLPTMRGGMIPELGRRVAEAQPDVLVISQLRAAPYLRFVPAAALWLDQADVWSLFLRQEIARRRGFSKRTAKMQLRQIRRSEVEWSQRATAISAAGYGDRSYLTSISGRPVEWLPTAVEQCGVERVRDGKCTAGFLGNFGFWPNRDAFEVLRDHWAPALRRLGWDTVVAGIGSEHLEDNGQVEILGPVDDLADYYSRIDVALAPIRLGGGIKVKIIEALMYRRPVLASQYALEGFPPDLSEAISAIDLEFPDFTCIADQWPMADLAFELAEKYFSVSTWNATISRLLSEATQGLRA